MEIPLGQTFLTVERKGFPLTPKEKIDVADRWKKLGRPDADCISDDFVQS